MNKKNKTFSFMLFVLSLLTCSCLSSRNISQNKTIDRDTICIDPLASKSNPHFNHSTNQIQLSKLNPKLELEEKYSKLLNMKTDQLPDYKLLAFAESWMGTPYRYGGTDKHGIDCSHFVAQLYRDVYEISLNGSSSTMYDHCDIHNGQSHKTGDLLFFKINRGRISHVGVYLANNHFIHASTKAGVTISNLNEAYYKRYYHSAGTPKDKK
ncbi:MAG: C40 family peptidase [Bacteroidetes bacterium]|nr:C40 family peptidase [Bacteroidota bacterium]